MASIPGQQSNRCYYHASNYIRDAEALMAQLKLPRSIIGKNELIITYYRPSNEG